MSPTVDRRRHTVLYTPHWRASGFAGVAEVADGGSSSINGGTTGALGHDRARRLGHTCSTRALLLAPELPASSASSPTVPRSGSAPGPTGDGLRVMGVVTNNVNAGPLQGGTHLARLGLLTPDSAVTATGPTLVTLAPVATLAGLRFLRFTSGGVPLTTWSTAGRSGVTPTSARPGDGLPGRRLPLQPRALRPGCRRPASRPVPARLVRDQTRHAPPRRRLGRPRPGGRGAALRPAGGTHVPAQSRPATGG